MGSTTPTNSQPLNIKKSRSTSSRIENPSISISESLTDLRFPQELITEILLRLPVKSLLKFKCVSKPWLSLISSPQFIRHHFSVSSREDKYFNHQLLYTTRATMKQCSLYSALHEAEPSEHVSDIAYPSHFPDHPPLIVGIVNGLVCLATGAAGLFLWNPVLRKFKHMNANLEAPFSGLAFNYGIGYDELNDDYKVVCFLRLYGSESVFESEVNVYSVRADSWRRIGDLKGFLPSNDSAIYANGKIYWSACVPAASTHDKKIISLDMVSEKFGEVQQPDYDPDYYYWKLGVLCGRPFVLCDYKGTKADLWVMDKYGVEESWCKMVSIPYDNVHPRTPYSHQQFLCILSNGEIVFENGFGLLVYNSKRKEYRNIELAVGKSSYMKASAYVESLVWPYG